MRACVCAHAGAYVRGQDNHRLVQRACMHVCSLAYVYRERCYTYIIYIYIYNIYYIDIIIISIIIIVCVCVCVCVY